jgi:UrcA family protein
MIGKFALPIVAAGLTTAFGLFAAPVMADPAKSAPRVTIDYRGVDLTSVEGRQTLDRRVDNAIDKICGRPVFGTHDENEILGECRREMRSRIEPMVATVLLKASANSASTN